MEMRLVEYFDRLTPARMFALGVLLLLFVAALDHLTGYELSFSIFYLIPIVLVTWFSGRGISIVFCIVAAVAWLIVDFSSSHTYSSGLIPLWNTGVRLSFFLITSILLGELRDRLENEKKIAVTDGLTGIMNARAFKKISTNLLELSGRYNHTFSLGYIDVDNFKEINDLFGHSEGDRVLILVANTLTLCARSTDVIGRLGGDEFAVFLPETDLAGAQIIFARMHQELVQVAKRGGWPIGFSIGVSVFTSPPESIDAALGIADNLMYRVKKSDSDNQLYEIQA